MTPMMPKSQEDTASIKLAPYRHITTNLKCNESKLRSPSEHHSLTGWSALNSANYYLWEAVFNSICQFHTSLW